MGDFSQNGIISNLHDFGTKTTADIEKELLKFSKEKIMKIHVQKIMLMILKKRIKKSQ